MKSHLSLTLGGIITHTTNLVVGPRLLLVLLGYVAMVSGPPASAANCLPPPSGLVSWWRAESNALDSTDGNNGTLQNGAMFAAGKVGQAFSLDGVDDVVIVPDAPNLRFGPTSPMTVDIWVFRTSSNPGQHLIGKRDSCTGSSSEGTFQLFLNMNTGIGLGFGPPGGACACSGQNLPLNTWTHLAGTFDGATLRLFINGQLVATTTGSLGPANTAPLKIGDSGSCGAFYGQAFGGLIDEVSIYNRALSTNEIQAIFDAGSAGKCEPPSPLQNLINVDFGYGSSSSKVGFAGTGQTPNDYWNFYTRDDGSGGYRTFGAVSNLKFANGAISSAGLTVANAPGAWGNGSSDEMYQKSVYPFDGGNIIVTVTNLPVGQYDFYLYNQEGNYQVTVGGTDYGIKTTSDPANTSPPVWQEGRQYALFRNMQVLSIGQAVVVTVRPGVGGLALISGMQIAVVSTTPPCTPAPSGLVSWWRAESNPLDSADGNTGTLQNGATIVAGKVGQAFSLDGVDDFVNVPDAPNLRFGPTTPMTVEMWAYRTSSRQVQHMIGKRENCTSSSTEGTYQLAFNMETGQGIGFGGPSDACACSGQDLPLNTWTHLAGTFDGTTLRLFINGQLAATTTGSLGSANTAPLKIGDSGSCGAAYAAAFGGLIDEVSIYDRALSTNEIQAIYTAGSAGKCEPPSPLQNLINVDFGYGTSSSKVGFAATGQTPNDYWNFYTRDDGSGGYRTFGAVNNLKYANGVASSVGLTVANAPGAWGNGSSDAMYQINIYPFDGGNITVTVTNLPVGQYDFYLYNQQGNYQVTVGGTDYGIKTTSDPVIVNPPVWQEGRQYALFRNVQVTSMGQAVVVTVRPGVGGLALISGMQIAAATGSTSIPAAPTGLTAIAGYGQVALSWNASSGATNYSVKRSLESGGPYNTIAAGAGLSYVDTGLNSGVTYYYVVSAVGAGGESTNSAPVNATPGSSSFSLMNIDFGYGTSSSKVGFAATGQTANDFWNFYTRDDGFGGYRTFGGVGNLKFANGAASSVGLTVANAPGAWGNGSSDAMYQKSVYPFDGGNITVTVTNLPIGQYDFYLYNQEGKYQVTVGGTDYGIKTTSDPANTSPPVWQEGKQYALFRNVQVSSVGQAVVITVRPGVGGLALISGMQIATVSPPPPACVSAPSGLVSWWRAESNALDSADGNNCTLQNGATIVAGKVGQAFSFDGVDDVVIVPDAPNLRFGPTSPMTVDMWVFRTSSSPAQHMIGKRAGCTSSSTEGTFQLAFDAANGLGFGNPGGSCACSGQVLPLNAWTHLAGTFDGTTLRLFINGQLAATTTGSLGPANTAPLKIGDSGTCGADYGAAFGGLIDEVSLYNRALSTNEIQGIYNASSAGKCPPQTCVPAPSGQISWWPAEGNANDVMDGNSGIITTEFLGQVLFSAGKVGQAFDFRGTNFVEIPPIALGNFTLELWVNQRTRGTYDYNFGSVLVSDEVCGVVNDWHTGVLPDGRIVVLIGGNGTPGTGTVFISSNAIPLNTFTYVAVTRSTNDGKVVIYLNGAMDSTHTASNNEVVGASDPTCDTGIHQNRIGIGNLRRQAVLGGNLEAFDGLIDEVSIYNRALSTNEIQAIYNAGSAGKCPPPTCVVPPSGLLSWWRAESNALDSTDGNNGTLQNGAAIVAGKVGQAFSLDGVDDVVIVPDAPNLRFGPTSPLTVDMWVFRTSSSLGQHLIGKRENCTGSSTEGTFQLFLDLNTGAGLGFGPPGGACACSGQDLPLNTWTHLAGTFDGATLRLFINGQLAATTTGLLGPANTAPLKIGDSGSCGAAYAAAFGGLIDEVSIYNRGLSTAEIQSIYNAGSAGKCVSSVPPPPVAPTIVTQPTNLTVYVGSNATFRVTANGDAPLAYQWRLNETNLPGKTSSVLTLPSVQFSNAGPYSVVVSNVSGSATSSSALLTVNPLPPCASVSDGLVSWWRAENNLIDNWDSNNGVTSSRFAAGKAGQAFSSPQIRVANSPSLQLSNALTIEAWIKPFAFFINTPNTIVSKLDYTRLIPFAPSNLDPQSSYHLGLVNNGHLFFTVTANTATRTNNTLMTTQVVPTNQWTFVVATYDGTHLRLYLNGALVAVMDHFTKIFPGTADLGLGAAPDSMLANTFNLPFNGLLDEVSLYNRALTGDEILAIYNADLIGKCLVAPSIVSQPQDQAIPLGEDVKFTVSVLGSRPLRYQWRFNGAVIAGATNSALVLEKLKTNQAGFYHVAVTNAVGFDISARAQLSLLPAPTCTDTPAGLISWWPGDTNRFDAMGINNITPSSPALYVTGKVDRAFSMNGTSSRITVPNSPSVNFGSNADFSIEMWIKAATTNTVFANVPLFEKKDGSTSWIGYSLSLNQGRLAFAMGSLPTSATNVSAFMSPGPDLRDAMFHHVAVSVNRTNTNGGNLYVDGQLVLTFDPTPRKGSLIAGTPLYLGAPSTTLSNSYFGGLIDEPALYNRALTASEILAIRQAGAAGKCKVKPTILVQPVGQRVTFGSNSTLSVTASGSPALRYQWFRDGGTISGATNSSYSFTIPTAWPSLPPEFYLFSVRVTNLFGSITSSNAKVILNDVPFASASPVVLYEDSITNIAVAGYDAELDPLTFIVVNPPQHGTLGPFVLMPGDVAIFARTTYTPVPNYNGPDSFTFKVNDGLVDSAPATVSLTVLPVNDPPVAQSQSVALDEDTAAAITLGAFDVEGDPLAFTVGTPSHGTLTGTPPNLTYRPNTNYFGPDAFTFSVSDGQTNSDLATVSLAVRPVNDPPVAEIVLAPLSHLPGVTNLLVIAPVGTNATVIFDGSRSTDVENDPLQYFWSEGTNSFATGVLATNRFAPGRHVLTLTVSDGQATGTNSVVLEVLSPAQAVGTLTALVETSDLGSKNANPLLASLRAAAASFDRGNAGAGINQLQAFQDKVLAQIAPLDPALAVTLIKTAQEIIDALSAPATARAPVKMQKDPTLSGNRRFQMHFNAAHGRTYFIEASTNLTTWEIIGVARDAGQNLFDFEDVHAMQFPGRFYRVLSR